MPCSRSTRSRALEAALVADDAPQVRPRRRHGGVEQGLEVLEFFGCLEHGPSPAPGCSPRSGRVRCWGNGGRTRPDPPAVRAGRARDGAARRGASGAAVVRHYVGYEEWPESAFLRREVARHGVALILGFGDTMDVFEDEVGSAGAHPGRLRRGQPVALEHDRGRGPPARGAGRADPGRGTGVVRCGGGAERRRGPARRGARRARRAPGGAAGRGADVGGAVAPPRRDPWLERRRDPSRTRTGGGVAAAAAARHEGPGAAWNRSWTRRAGAGAT